MKLYKQINIEGLTPERSDLLTALLSAIGFEGFEEKDNMLKAFAAADMADMDALSRLAQEHRFTFAVSDIAETNWNALWEANFEPVRIGRFTGIRAHFHPPLHDVQHEIQITPKMSFGTGHHATTFMMIEEMAEIDFVRKKVLDFGTGTGVLAILAEKLGAAQVLAIDNDEWSVENAKENMDKNNCEKITVSKADTVVVNQTFDVILANINKNVLLENMESLSRRLNSSGVILMSGLLKEDEKDVAEAAAQYQLKKTAQNNKLQWIALRFERKT